MLKEMLWKEALEKKEESKIWSKIYNWLNRDNLGNITLVGEIFFFELNPSSIMPNYVYHFLVKWGEQKGYKYLYNL
ncbi:hypothetical protein ES708_27089 [subsurface metagenome]